MLLFSCGSRFLYNLYKMSIGNWQDCYFLILAVFSTLSILIIDKTRNLSMVMRIMIIFLFLFILILFFSFLYKTCKSIKDERITPSKLLFSFAFFVTILLFIIVRSILAITVPFDKARDLYGKDETVTGIVSSFIAESGTKAFYSNDLMGFQELNGEIEKEEQRESILIKTKYGLVSLYCMAKYLKYGDLLSVNLSLSQPSPSRNPGGFDERKYYYSNGIYLKGKLVNSVEPTVIKETENLLYKSAGLTRSKVLRIFNKNLPSREAGLMAGLLLGDRSGMDKEETVCYQKAGLSHITAVSGSAVTFLLIPLQVLLRKVKISKRKKSIIISTILIFFGFVTGWTPSISRALVMVFVLIIAKSLHKKMTVLQSLFITIVILLAIAPVFALNVGFWLSSLATAGIMRLSESIENIISRRYSLPDIIISTVSVSLAAGLAVMPFAVWISKEISFASVVSGVFVLPIVEFTTIFGSFEALAGIFNESCFLTKLLAIPLKGLLYSIYNIASFISKIGFLHYKTAGISFIFILSISAFVIFLFIKETKIKRLCLIMTVCIFSTGIIHFVTEKAIEPGLRIVFADVGQGDATLILLKTGESLLIDSGGESKGTTAINRMLDFYSIRYPTIYIATHTHEDHCGGMVNIIRERGGETLIVPFGTIKDNKSDKTSDGSIQKSYGELDLKDELLKSATDRNMKICETGFGDVIKVNDKFKMTIYNPDKISDNAANNNFDNAQNLDSGGNQTSLIIKIEFSNKKILIMGDAPGDIEQKLADSKIDISVDIYRISHHGSPSSTNHDIISAVSPQLSIISVGANFYGHPSPKVIKRLYDAGGEILRTDEKGAIILEINKDKLQIDTMIP